jgi:hypothetical protein
VTEAQKLWLDKNRARGYGPVGRISGNAVYRDRGILHADGTFDLTARGARPTRITDGCFEVGILEVPEPQYPRGRR